METVTACPLCRTEYQQENPLREIPEDGPGYRCALGHVFAQLPVSEQITPPPSAASVQVLDSPAPPVQSAPPAGAPRNLPAVGVDVLGVVGRLPGGDVAVVLAIPEAYAGFVLDNLDHYHGDKSAAQYLQEQFAEAWAQGQFS